MEAVAGYLRGLREGQDITQTEVAAVVGKRLKRNVQTTTIWRIETGQNVPKSDMLIAILSVIGGSVKDLADLQALEKDSDEEGYAQAAVWLKTAAAHATPEQRQAVAGQLRVLADALDGDQAS